MGVEEELGYHRKYRPNKLSDYIGNDKLVKSLLDTLKKWQKTTGIFI